MKVITNPTDAMFLLFVVSPIEEIIKDLNNGFTYRLDYLDNKLAAYMKTAAETLGFSAALVGESANKPVEKNQYAKDYYLKYFGQLLDFFKNH